MNKLVIGITLFLAIFSIVYLYSNVSYWDVNRYIITVGEEGQLNTVSEKYFKDFEDRLTKKVEDKLKNVVMKKQPIKIAWKHGKDQDNDGWGRGCRFAGCNQGYHYLGTPTNGDVLRMASLGGDVRGGQGLKDYERANWVIV
jgi:hypothetical protein